MITKLLLAFYFCWFATIYTADGKTVNRPNIVFILGDDIGYNDVGYHNPNIKTPELDKLASEGVRLENYYVQPICSPTRSQLLTGRYQIHTGLQHSVIAPTDRRALPSKFTTLPQKLKQYGYRTHLVGKWHLGMYKKEFLPVNRGFDSYYGYLSGAEDYYNHTRAFKNVEYLDLHNNTDPDWTQSGHYSTHLFTEKAVGIINSHPKNEPLFLYLPYQNCHGPLQVPDAYSSLYSFQNKKRKTFAGMMSALDEGIGNVTKALKKSGLWNNTLLIFSSDNGGSFPVGGNNWPMRGKKFELFEGGMKVPGFVVGKGIKNPGRISKQMIHISDWFPTLVEGVAKGNVSDLDPLDGINQWRAIMSGKGKGRDIILHNIDPLWQKQGIRLYNDTFDNRIRAAIRVGDFKLITGAPSRAPGKWWAPPEQPNIKTKGTTDSRNKNLWLFNITADPNEENDLSAQNPSVVKVMLKMLQNFDKTSVKALPIFNDDNCDPSKHGNVWGPWM